MVWPILRTVVVPVAFLDVQAEQNHKLVTVCVCACELSNRLVKLMDRIYGIWIRYLTTIVTRPQAKSSTPINNVVIVPIEIQ